jgi:MFS transporter, DHA1 family, tetracycline resistance protein
LAFRGSLFLASIPFIALWGVAGPSMQSLMSRRVDPSSQGKLQGAINSLRGITGMVGPVLFTQVFAFAIAKNSPLHVAGAPYFLAAALLGVSLVIAILVTRGSAGGGAPVGVISPEPILPEPTVMAGE